MTLFGFSGICALIAVIEYYVIVKEELKTNGTSSSSMSPFSMPDVAFTPYYAWFLCLIASFLNFCSIGALFFDRKESSSPAYETMGA